MRPRARLVTVLAGVLTTAGCAGHDLARRGRQALAAGDEREATRLLARAAAHTPDDPAVWRDLARAHFRSGTLQDAAAAIDRAVILKPDDPETILLRGQIHMNRGQRSAGVDDARWAAEHARDAVVLQQAAIVLLRGGQTQACLAAARRAIDLSGDAPDAYVNLAVLAAEAHAPAVVEQTLQAGLERHPDHVALRQTWAAWLAGTGRPAQARLEYRRLLADHPQPGLVHLALALLAHDQGDLADALAHARTAVDALGGRRADVHHTYVVVLRDSGQADAAHRHLQRARRRFPSDERLRQLESTWAATSS